MTTNYINTFIEVAEDCPADVAEVPPATAKRTVAALQYDLIANHPYEYSSDDVIFEVYALRQGIAAEDKPVNAKRSSPRTSPAYAPRPSANATAGASTTTTQDASR